MTKTPLRTAPRKRKGRSGHRNPAVPGLDGRSKVSRRFRDIVVALSLELGPGEPSTSQLALARQAALSTVLAEQLQARALQGSATSAEVAEIARLGNVAARCLIALGVKRKGANGPDLDTYLAEKRAREAQA